MLGKLLGPSYDKKVVRRRPVKGDKWDKAAEITDEDAGDEKQWKLKSDGETVPAPSQDKIGYLFYRKWYHKLLFMPEQKTEYAILDDRGGQDGEWKDLSKEDTFLTGGGNSHIFQTHRNLQVQKYVDLYSKDDNTQLWLAGYLTVLALVTIGAAYMIVNGVEQGVKAGAEAAVQGAKAGASGASGGADSVPGTGMLPVIGLYGRFKIKNLKNRWL